MSQFHLKDATLLVLTQIEIDIPTKSAIVPFPAIHLINMQSCQFPDCHELICADQIKT